MPLSFELVALDRVLAKGSVTEQMVSVMTDATTKIKSAQEVEFSLMDYLKVARAAPPGTRLIPPCVLQTVLPRSDEAKWNEGLAQAKMEDMWRRRVAPRLSPMMRALLKPHQRIAIVKALKAKRFMIADDM